MEKIYVKEYNKLTKLYIVASAFGINLFSFFIESMINYICTLKTYKKIRF